MRNGDRIAITKVRKSYLSRFSHLFGRTRRGHVVRANTYRELSAYRRFADKPNRPAGQFLSLTQFVDTSGLIQSDLSFTTIKLAVTHVGYGFWALVNGAIMTVFKKRLTESGEVTTQGRVLAISLLRAGSNVTNQNSKRDTFITSRFDQIRSTALVKTSSQPALGCALAGRRMIAPSVTSRPISLFIPTCWSIGLGKIIPLRITNSSELQLHMFCSSSYNKKAYALMSHKLSVLPVRS